MMAANDSQRSGEAVFLPEAENHRAYRNALGSFTTGVTVVTAMSPSGPIGMTVNSFASVSLDPPLVLWSPAKNSSKHDAFANASHFAIHVLGAGQDHLSAAFTRGGAAFDGLEVEINPQGVPVLPGTLARFECLQQALHDAGDHTIIIGRVTRVAHRQGDPLCFSQGRFGRFAV
ncbi:flavin reductase family protein [Rhizobium sp. SL42]|uniref:flavin reductase family protein n=1 Tax=Rhizobium sp. SL42 TaxID=2806346 RepID=UPI001F2CFF37|nr:flavin reductase family protein [Rhizobium sp. SL42]UJW77037.1 flavin reductase family protein [Rhizobium sp. SL42]